MAGASPLTAKQHCSAIHVISPSPAAWHSPDTVLHPSEATPDHKRAPISPIDGRFRPLRQAKWLIYGTQTGKPQVRTLEFQRAYPGFSCLNAIYKPLGKFKPVESAIHRRSRALHPPFARQFASLRPTPHPCNAYPLPTPPADKQSEAARIFNPHRPRLTIAVDRSYNAGRSASGSQIRRSSASEWSATW